MVNEYINYFRSLAISHKDLQHDPASETDSAPAASKHFTRIAIDEVLSGLKSAVGFPCLTLELYQVDTQSNGISVNPMPSGAFMIIDHPASDSFADEQSTYEKTERIVYELLQKIWQDHKPGSDICARPFSFFDFDKILIEPVGPVFNGEYGYRVTFNLELQKTIDITKPPAAGTFL